MESWMFTGRDRKEYGEQADHLISKEQLENGEGFRKTKTDQQTPETAPLGSVRYDLIRKLVRRNRTHARQHCYNFAGYVAAQVCHVPE